MQILKCTKHRPRFYRLRIWICYIFIYFHDFYAAKLKLSEIEEWAVNFVMNRKKRFWVSKFSAAILNVSFSVRNFIKIQGPFPKKCMFFFKSHWYIIGNLHFSTYQIWKNILGPRRFYLTGDMMNLYPFIQGWLEWPFSELFSANVSLWNQCKYIAFNIFSFRILIMLYKILIIIGISNGKTN